MSQLEKVGHDWIASLAPGDEVAIFEGGWPEPYRLAKVARLTSTQVIVDDRGRRFRRTGGVEVAKSYSPSIGPATDEIRARIKAADNRSRFKLLVYREEQLTDEHIAAMLSAYDVAQGREAS